MAGRDDVKPGAVDALLSPRDACRREVTIASDRRRRNSTKLETDSLLVRSTARSSLTIKLSGKRNATCVVGDLVGGHCREQHRSPVANERWPPRVVAGGDWNSVVAVAQDLDVLAELVAIALVAAGSVPQIARRSTPPAPA